MILKYCFKCPFKKEQQITRWPTKLPSMQKELNYYQLLNAKIGAAWGSIEVKTVNLSITTRI